jgi:hypothetical protein
MLGVAHLKDATTKFVLGFRSLGDLTDLQPWGLMHLLSSVPWCMDGGQAHPGQQTGGARGQDLSPWSLPPGLELGLRKWGFLICILLGNLLCTQLSDIILPLLREAL